MSWKMDLKTFSRVQQCWHKEEQTQKRRASSEGLTHTPSEGRAEKSKLRRDYG